MGTNAWTDYFVGFGDRLSFGSTRWLREHTPGGDYTTSYCSEAYKAGQEAADLYGIGMALVDAPALIGNLRGNAPALINNLKNLLKGKQPGYMGWNWRKFENPKVDEFVEPTNWPEIWASSTLQTRIQWSQEGFPKFKPDTLPPINPFNTQK